MKKQLLTAILAAGTATGAFAQGTVVFENSAGSGNITFDSSSGANASPGQYTVALLWAAGTSVVPQSSLTQIAIYTPTAGGGNGAGFFQDPTVVTTPAGTAGGAQAVFEVVGWTGNFANWAAAQAGAAKIGQSAEFINGTGNPGGSPATPAVLLSGTGGAWNGNLVIATPVPEPTTLALGALGAAALLAFRRRKN